MRRPVFIAGITLLLAGAACARAADTKAPAVAADSSAAVKSAATAFVVTFHVKPGKNAEFEQAFREMQANVRKREPGNVYYDFFVSEQDPQSYVIIERYKDAAAVAAHGKSDHAKELFSRLRELMSAPPEARRLVLLSAGR